jgi:predicted nucleic acid-binding protein
MILDTSFIIDIMAGRSEALDKLEELENSSKPISTTTISLFELWSGIELSDKPEEEKDKVKNVLASLNIYSFEEKSAKISGKIQGRMSEEGFEVVPEDSKIAGIAVRNSEKMITKDKDFREIEKISTLEIEKIN